MFRTVWWVYSWGVTQNYHLHLRDDICLDLYRKWAWTCSVRRLKSRLFEVSVENKKGKRKLLTKIKKLPWPINTHFWNGPWLQLHSFPSSVQSHTVSFFGRKLFQWKLWRQKSQKQTSLSVCVVCVYFGWWWQWWWVVHDALCYCGVWHHRPLHCVSVEKSCEELAQCHSAGDYVYNAWWGPLTECIHATPTLFNSTPISSKLGKNPIILTVTSQHLI